MANNDFIKWLGLGFSFGKLIIYLIMQTKGKTLVAITPKTQEWKH
jgi:hypothetical protein